MLQGPEVRDRLRRVRGVTYAPAPTMVTLKDIARKLGVAPSTVGRALDQGLEGLCVALLAITVTLTVLQVFYRYILGASLAWTEELARFTFVWSVFLGFAVHRPDEREEIGRAHV